MIRGEQFAFLELLDAVQGPAHIVYVTDNPLVHSAQVIVDQLRRTDAERQAIAGDMAAAMAGGAVTPTAADWVFGGAMLNALDRSPVSEGYTVLARDGLREAGPPDAIVLSAHAESRVIYRHRRLGFHVLTHNFRLNDAGPAYRHWLSSHFERVRRTVETIRADYDTLIDLVRAQAPNDPDPDLQHDVHVRPGRCPGYAAFDEPLGETLTSVHAQDMNLMLCDLAHAHDIAVVDADAIAAELGGAGNLRDGVHQSGAMQAETRAEILRILRDARRSRLRRSPLADLELDRHRGDALDLLRQRFVRRIAEQGERRADHLPVALGTEELSQHARLAGAHLDQGLVGFQLDDQFARRECLTQLAVPLEHPNFLHILDRSGTASK